MLNNNETPTNNDIIDPKEKTEEIQPSEKKEDTEEACSIYNHFKAHPASALAAFSAIVAIITFFAQLMAYITNKTVLEYWGYSASYASVGSENLLYSATSAIVYAVVIALSAVWFLKNCDVYIERRKYTLTFKYLIKKIKRINKDNIKKIGILEKAGKEDFDELAKIKADVETTKNEVKSLSKANRKNRIEDLRDFFINLLPILFLSGVSAFIMSLLLEQTIEQWETVLGILVVQLFTLFIMYLLERKALLKKKIIKKNVNDLEASEALKIVETKNNYPLENLPVYMRSNKKGIKNSTFIILPTYVLLICVIFVAYFGPSARKTEEERKTFEIINLEGEEYAIVYHSNNTYFLEKATFDEDELTIHINHQRIISNEDVSFTVKTFDKITKDDSEVLP